jgi:GT2 family glycosyltransferase
MQMDLSVIIVNYNTIELLRNCLHSIYMQTSGITLEIWVVDNASTDGSPDMVEAEFPNVKLIRSNLNQGFSKANNMALRQCSSEYCLLLNPDTTIPENTFKKVIDFMELHPDAGAVGCKLLKADETLDIACKRSFPTPWNSFCKVLKLHKLFPKNKLFGKYNLTYMDENETHSIDCIVGAFMMLPKKVIDEVGLLDEDFFMYGEDIDWCFRIKKAGYEIYYYPETFIWHLKGESSKKQSKRMIKEFHKSMFIYYNKHHKSRYNFMLNCLVYLGIYLRWGFILLVNGFRREKRVS